MILMSKISNSTTEQYSFAFVVSFSYIIIEQWILQTIIAVIGLTRGYRVQNSKAQFQKRVKGKKKIFLSVDNSHHCGNLALSFFNKEITQLQWQGMLLKNGLCKLEKTIFLPRNTNLEAYNWNWEELRHSIQ